MKEDGGPAFPAIEHEYPNGVRVDGGMTLRDWLAGMALNAALYYTSPQTAEVGDLAKQAYKIADAMLEERKR